MDATGRDHVVELESLRGVAASGVFLFHCWVLTSAAVLTWNLGPVTGFMEPLQSGVTLFFVLSGFLLYRPVVAAVLDGRPGQPVGAYLRNRALRIIPAFWVVLLVSSFVLQSSVAQVVPGRGSIIGPVSDPGILAANLLLVQTYHASSVWTGVLPTWSLTVELAFYLALPLLALLAHRLGSRAAGTKRAQAVLAPVAAILIFGVLGKVLVEWLSPGPARTVSASWHSVLDRSFVTHADLFGFGMAAAVLGVLWARRPQGPPRFVANGVTGRILAYVGLPIFISGFYFLPAYLYDSLVAAFGAVLLLRVISPYSVGRGTRLLRHRWTASWGRVSYSVFLWNFPVLTFLGLHGLQSDHGAWGFLRMLVVAVPTVALLSFLTYRFVEAPALALKHRGARRQEPAPAPARVAA